MHSTLTCADNMGYACGIWDEPITALHPPQAVLAAEEQAMPSLKRVVVCTIRQLLGMERYVRALQAKQEQDFAQILRESTVRTILSSSPESWFDCLMNGTRMWLPRHSLQIKRRDTFAQKDGPFVVWTETLQMDFLKSKLKPGDVFLDVGASIGELTLPISMAVPGVRVVSFEPNRTANNVLRDTLNRNGVSNVELLPQAISDFCGETTFNEHGFDPTGNCHFLPETSTIDVPDRPDPHIVAQYQVPVITLDDFFAQRPDAGNVRSIKIDVEGFETKVLHGATNLIARTRPYISIDIHSDPFGDGSTEAGVRACLAPMGYRIEKMNFYVLFCHPSPN